MACITDGFMIEVTRTSASKFDGCLVHGKWVASRLQQPNGSTKQIIAKKKRNGETRETIAQLKNNKRAIILRGGGAHSD